MKKSIFLLPLFSLLATNNSVAGSSGTITFTGELTDTTCEVDVNGQGSDANVILPTISINQLTTAGDTAGRTSFNMNLSKCVVGTEGGHSKVSAFFLPGSTVDLSTGRLKNTTLDGAKNVGLQMLDGSGNYAIINVGNTDQRNDMTYVDIDQAGGTALLPYAVEYYADGQSSPGVVTSSVIYNLQYK